MSIRHFRVELEYDGTAFSGWQVQPGARTIQGDVERALRLLTHEDIRAHSAGRTDAGVHALGQVISFSSTSRIDAQQVALGLNRYLPSDVRARRSGKVPAEFHARYSARAKTYGYTALIGRGARPLLSRYAATYWPEVDVDKMREAAALMVGKHEFAAFAASGRQPGPTVRTVHEVAIEVVSGEALPGPVGWSPPWAEETPAIRFTVIGGGFLYKMVRSLAGALVAAGEGKLTPAKIREILASRTRTNVVLTAPPQGLFLEKVFYR